MGTNGNGNGNGYDWEAIEDEVRAGRLSLREIARRHGCSDTAIRKRMKARNIKRDLSKRVMEKVRTELVRNQVRKSNVNDDEIVEKAAKEPVQVVLLERKDIKALRALENKLMAELADDPTKLYITQYKGKIIKKVVGLTVAEKMGALRDLATTRHKRIQLERQAWNLAESAGSEGEFDTVRVAFVKPRAEDDD